MKRLTRDALTIYWQGDEVSGLTFYGLRHFGHEDSASLLDIHCDYVTDSDISLLSGNAWEVVVWYVKVAHWPSATEFPGLIKCGLERMQALGCVVSWLGCPGNFVDPPDLFLPEFMSGGVLAAITAPSRFEIAVNLDEPLCGLPDDVLLRLREESKGLAQAI